MNVRLSQLVAVAVTLAGLSASAHALDAWRDRRGLLFGVAGGGGGAKADATGVDERVLGFNLRARVGGGVTEQFTIDGEYGFNLHSGDGFSRQLHQFGAFGNLFPVAGQGFYLRGGGGMVQGFFDLDAPRSQEGSAITSRGGRSDSELGLMAGGGLGFEFFVNADLAIGLLADFQHHWFKDFNVNAFNFGLTATWY
jgi:hypothetical protein